jgi:hypothetical protein
MPDEPTLFDDQARRRPDATDRQKVVYEDDADEDGDPVDAEAVAAAALSALEEEGERDTVRAEYARLLWSAAQGGISLQADNGEYVAVEALTDKEAAKKLGREKTTINARRGELMGDRPEYEACPVVVEAGSRESYVRGTGLENTTYAINPRLIEAAKTDT